MPEYKSCANPKHSATRSQHPKWNVPIELFRKCPDDPTSKLCVSCMDCRRYEVQRTKARLDRRRRLTLGSPDQFVCGVCHQVKKNDDRSTNLDGSAAVTCTRCKALEYAQTQKRARMLATVKLTRIRESGTCCYSCRSMFLKPSHEDDIRVRVCPVEDGYVNFAGRRYEVHKFLDEFQDQIEMSVLEFDHLTEQEQRERGILLECDAFVPKIALVSNFGTVASMTREARKCQLLCCKCHLETTIRRCAGKAKSSLASIVKRDYVNELKERLGGCTICKSWIPNFHTYYEFDHLDPDLKVAAVSTMVMEAKYTLEHIKVEVPKTRLLCKMCHRVHTTRQRVERNNKKRRIGKTNQ